MENTSVSARESLRHKEDLLVTLERQLAEENKTAIKMSKLEGMEEAANIKRSTLFQGQVNAELKMANKLHILVRRAALRKLFEQDHRQYQQELSSLGKAFHIERI